MQKFAHGSVFLTCAHELSSGESLFHYQKHSSLTGCQGFTPVILDTQEAEIRRIMVLGQPRQIVCETLFQKYLTQKRARRVTQVVMYWPSSMRA
jgi:hypothetical protein